MTMTQGNPASADSDIAPSYQMWCPFCYTAGIERLCRGFTINHNKPSFPPSVIPPLAPGTALSVRAARDAILAQRADWKSEAARHPQHAGARS